MTSYGFSEISGYDFQLSLWSRKYFRFCGFCFVSHSKDSNKYIQLSLYQDNHDSSYYVLCLAEGFGKGNVEKAEFGLGGLVIGANLSQYANRIIEDSNLDFLKNLFQKVNPKAKWHWEKE